mmetsp:Transcript_12726/g.27919  ORF Transcript_12726/g.27919 Transcript_12726/m.27919 type:complete len:138 (+) Transcript_12726:102-515(+)
MRRWLADSQMTTETLNDSSPRLANPQSHYVLFNCVRKASQNKPKRRDALFTKHLAVSGVDFYHQIPAVSPSWKPFSSCTCSPLVASGEVMELCRMVEGSCCAANVEEPASSTLAVFSGALVAEPVILGLEVLENVAS